MFFCIHCGLILTPQQIIWQSLFQGLTPQIFGCFLVCMNTIPPDSFYLVCVDKPNASDTIDSRWQAWQRFLKSIAETQEQPRQYEKLTENLFLFDSKKDVLKLNRFLDSCKKEVIAAKVFYLPQKPEICE
jgi:hypothetical protein